MMHPLRTTCLAAAIGLAAAAAPAQDQPGPPADATSPQAKPDGSGRSVVKAATLSPETNRFMVYYYINPQPDRFEAVFLEVAAATGPDAGGNGPVFSAFYAQILKDNPARIEGWIKSLSGPEIAPVHKRALWRAAVLTRIPEGKAALTALLQTLPEDTRAEDRQLVQDFLRMEAADLLGEIPRTTRALDMMWSAFNGSGDERYVDQVIDAMKHETSQDGSDVMFAAAAGYSLLSNAWQHSKVLEVCRQRVKTAQEPIKKRLEEIVQMTEERLKSAPCPEPEKGA